VFASDGRRRSLYWLDAVLGPPLRLGRGDVLLSAGADWGSKDPAMIAALKQRSRFRLVMVCYDLIPILYPQFYGARDVDVFSRYFSAVVAFADRMICISERTASDLASFARSHGRNDLDIRSERLGADAAHATSGVPLPKVLAPGRYVLFVSTIEPRKNHALLLRAWRRIVAGEGGGASDFKLVFAGRRGWMTEDIIATLAGDPVIKKSVVHFDEASDALLDTLYRHAAFCVYPSLYEGFGLPVVEAFAHGKAVISSNGGSLPEVAGTLAPCLDPSDEGAWVAAIGRWINDPAALAAAAQRVAAEFSWPTWSEAARRIVALARES
jgi:glycosyltransferase involved in cell wall biosynthesis